MLATVVSRYGVHHEANDLRAAMSSGMTQAHANGAGGSIDFRLARERTIMAYKSGEATRSEVCDAQRELMRNARECGVPVEPPCPICGERSLVEVLYVFGPRLPASGRCIVTNLDMDRIRSYSGEFTGYDVEVCTRCGWNHLMRTNPVV